MKNQRILDSLGQVKEEYIVEAAPGSQSFVHRLPRKPLAAVACFALLVILGGAIWRMGGMGHDEQTIVLENGDTIIFVSADVAASQLALDLDAEIRQLTPDEMSFLFQDMPITGWGIFDAKENQLIGFEGEINGVKVVVSLEDIQLKDTEIDGIEQTSSVEGVPVAAGFFLTKPNSRGVRTAIYYASFTLGSNTIYVEIGGAEEESESIKKALALLIVQFIRNGEFDLRKISYCQRERTAL